METIFLGGGGVVKRNDSSYAWSTILDKGEFKLIFVDKGL